MFLRHTQLTYMIVIEISKLIDIFLVKIFAHAVTYLLFSQFENNIFDILTVGKKHLYRITFIQ